MAKDPGVRKASVVLFSLCVLAASAIAGAAVYRYFFWGDQLPGGFASALVDHDADGAPEYLIVQARVDVPESGDYSATAMLFDPSGGTLVTQTSGRVELDRGTNVFGAGFWTPDIRDREVSGPYEVRLSFTRERSDGVFELPASPEMVGRVYQATFRTPAYGWQEFPAQPRGIEISGAVTSVRTDFDSDGEADGYALRVPLDVRSEGTYAIRAESDDLFLTGVTDRIFDPASFSGPQFASFARGSLSIDVAVPHSQVYLSGIDGEADIHVTVSQASLVGESHPCCGTGPSLQEVPAFAPPPAGPAVGLRDPYVLPPTPLGLEAEAHFTETLRWYEFEAPWMPIEFTGDARDWGTDVDSDGLFDYLVVEADVILHSMGWYDLSGILYAQGAQPNYEVLLRSVPDAETVVATSWTRLGLQDWSTIDQVQSVQLAFSGAEILAAGIDGPYSAKLRIVPANVVIDPIVVHMTSSYALSEFEATAPKTARISGVEAIPTGDGVYRISVQAPADARYNVITRVIHANGVVSLDSTMAARSVMEFTFGTESAHATDFAVAVYLQMPDGSPADYLEIALS